MNKEMIISFTFFFGLIAIAASVLVLSGAMGSDKSDAKDLAEYACFMNGYPAGVKVFSVMELNKTAVYNFTCDNSSMVIQYDVAKNAGTVVKKNGRALNIWI